MALGALPHIKNVALNCTDHRAFCCACHYITGLHIGCAKTEMRHHKDAERMMSSQQQIQASGGLNIALTQIDIQKRTSIPTGRPYDHNKREINIHSFHDDQTYVISNVPHDLRYVAYNIIEHTARYAVCL